MSVERKAPVAAPEEAPAPTGAIKITGDFRKNGLARKVPDSFFADSACLPQRIRDKLQVNTAGCWLWTACLHADGYGKTVLDGRYRYAHCAVYELLIGAVTVGLELDHLCRVRACCNPAHLEPVTGNVNRGRGLYRNQHQDKTHCPRGHEYTPENTYSYAGRAGRSCKTCKRLRKACLL